MNQHLVTTKPACAPCSRCGRLQLLGLEEGAPYRTEPAPLTAVAELRARLAGRRTYALIAGELAARDATRIRGDRRRGRPPVFAQHDCYHPATENDIDTTYLKRVTKLIETASLNITGPGRLVIQDQEIDALFLINRKLGGKVIAINDKPPF